MAKLCRFENVVYDFNLYTLVKVIVIAAACIIVNLVYGLLEGIGI